jgi:hypothetical protein
MKKPRKKPTKDNAMNQQADENLVESSNEASEDLDTAAPAPQTATPEYDVDPEDLQPGALPPEVGHLTVKLSVSLIRKIRQIAGEEGVTAEDLCQELLAEGVVLRAWEIIGRKNVQRTGPNQPQNQNQQQNRHNNPNNRHNKGRGRFGKQRGGGGGAWMEDKAAFLEYVRNQERNRR